jgi:hypothetical protein
MQNHGAYAFLKTINSYCYILQNLTFFKQLQPPRSPYLKARDYYLSGPMKEVYFTNPHFLQELKEKLKRETANISRQLVLRSMLTSPRSALVDSTMKYR